MEWIFWISLFLAFYTYIGYGILIYGLVKFKRLFSKHQIPEIPENKNLPEVTLIIAAYNEKDFIIEKAKNTLALDYPSDKIKLMFVTDGSSDGTPDLLKQFPEIEVLHRPERLGKIAAMNRAMTFVKTPIVIFSDANTYLNPLAIKEIVKHYQNEKVGAVAGEKRIFQPEKAQAAQAGEGLYWKYESFLKKMDFEYYSVVGAAGELFSLRTQLFHPSEPDTLLDDFMISLRIAGKGYRVAYEPNAYAMETGSESTKEELKRKVRISAGGLQSIVRLAYLLNFFRYGKLTFQYVSHRVLRWTLTPLSLLCLLISNAFLMFEHWFLMLFFAGQTMFYTMAILGFILAQREIKVKILFVPYYFTMMNYAVFLGFFRFIGNKQSVLWEKAKRK